MIKINTISATGIIISNELKEFSDYEFSKAYQKLNEYQAKNIFKSKFEDPVWLFSDGKKNFRFTFTEFYSEKYISLFEEHRRDINRFVSDFKCYVSLLLGRCSLEMLRHFVSFVAEELVLSDLGKKSSLNKVTVSISMLNYYKDFIEICLEPCSDYVKSIKRKIILLSIKNNKKSNPSLLVEFSSYFLFDDLIIDWWRNIASTNEKNYFYPLYLFWRLTCILPLRVTEFCLTPLDCLEICDGNYYIIIRRSLLKGNNNNSRIIKHSYDIDKDYEKCKYQVTDELYNLFLNYIELTKNYSRNYGLLFSLDFMTENSIRIHNKEYAEFSVFDDEALNKLLDDFYSTIIGGYYGLIVIDEETIKSRYVNADDSEYTINAGEIMKLQLKHTRHLAMINLVFSGCSPMMVKEFAGHSNENISANYYGNIKKLCRARIVYVHHLAIGKKKTNIYYSRPTKIDVSTDKSGAYIELDNGRCYSPNYVNDIENDVDCSKAGYDCFNCKYFSLRASNSVSKLEKDVDRLMGLISKLLRDDELEMKLDEFLSGYHQMERLLNIYINLIEGEDYGEEKQI